MVAEGDEIDLRGIEHLPHLLAAVPLAQQTRRHEIAGENERYRAGACE